MLQTAYMYICTHIYTNLENNPHHHFEISVLLHFLQLNIPCASVPELYLQLFLCLNDNSPLDSRNMTKKLVCLFRKKRS